MNMAVGVGYGVGGYGWVWRGEAVGDWRGAVQNGLVWRG